MLEKINLIMKQYIPIKRELIKEVKSEWLKIKVENITLANGKIIQRDIIVKPKRDAVVIIPKTINNNYLMVIQPRTATDNGVNLEFPAGYVEDGENIVDGAKRELLEETGYECDKIKIIKTYYQDVACSNSKITLLIAEGCHKINDQKLDDDEMITFVELTYDNLIELLNSNIITDANSILGLYYLKSK